MDLFQNYKDPKYVNILVKQIEKEIKKPLKIMEVCGGHTHTIMKYGLPQILPSLIEFVHGPGCPVCVMPKERIDHALILAKQKDLILATLGDMIRVPGSKGSLQTLRSSGADIKSLYTPLDVIKIAKQNPLKKVVFFAIGFETTTPMTVSVIKMAISQNIKNLYFHINHVLVPEIIEHLLDDGEVMIDSFLGPSHVSVITGSDIFVPISKKYKKSIVIAGFEPTDVLESILMLVRQSNNNETKVENQYTRAVTPKGNLKAQELISFYLKRRDSFRWRGLGEVPNSALKLKDEYSFLDAESVFSDILPNEPIKDNKSCICGQILKGLAKPHECKVFAKVCNPKNPIGSCMVSSEGACAAYFRYNKIQKEIV